jgi:hypothetical protein
MTERPTHRRTEPPTDQPSRQQSEPDDREQRLMRPDGQRYAAPESDEARSSKSWAYAALALLVVVLLVLIATGTVPIFPR